MPIETIFLVPLLVAGTLLLLGAVLGFYDGDWTYLLNAGYLAGIASALFILVYLAVVGLIPVFSPWHLSALEENWVEVLVYFPLLVLVIRFWGKTLLDISSRDLRNLEEKGGQAQKGPEERAGSQEEGKQP